MNKVQILSRLIRAMFGLLILVFFFVLFRSLGGPAYEVNSGTDSIAAFDDVVIGQTALRRFAGQRVWVTRLSELQRSQAEQLNNQLVTLASGCAPTVTLCAVSAKTHRAGVEIVFTDAPPPAVPSRVSWYGGFIDPTSGQAFDRLGRAYRINGPHGVAGLDVVFAD